MRRYKMRCRFCIFFKVENGVGFCELFKHTTHSENTCEERK